MNQSIVPCLVLILAPWLAYRFLQTRKVIWSCHLFNNFPQFVVIYTIKEFGIVNEAEVDVFFLKFPCYLHDPTNVDNLISGSSAFSKTNLYIWKFSIHVLLKPNFKDFEHYLVSMWNEWNSVVFNCHSFSLGWKLTFSSPVATAGFSKFANILSAALYQHHLLVFETA